MEVVSRWLYTQNVYPSSFRYALSEYNTVDAWSSDAPDIRDAMIANSLSNIVGVRLHRQPNSKF